MPVAVAATRLVLAAAAVTTSWAVSDDAARVLLPAHDAETPVGYVPAAMPLKLALFKVATPLAFVDALPTPVPLSENEMDLPETGVEHDVSVAVREADPPAVPLASLATSEDEAGVPVSAKSRVTVPALGTGIDVTDCEVKPVAETVSPG